MQLLHAFFSNRAVNLLNFHQGVNALADGMGGVFIFVFLLRAGLSPFAVLLTIALIVALRLLTRPLLLVIAKRWGLKRSVILGSLLTAAQYPILGQGHGTGWTLVALIAVSSVGSTLYWPAYHAYFASVGDNEARGHQIGAREAIGAVAGVAAPLMGGWMLVSVGPAAGFAVVGLVQVLGVLPLLAAPDVPVKRSVAGAYRAAIEGTLLFTTNGWLATSFFAWQIALFLSLDQSYAAFAGATAFAGLVGAACGMFLGRHIDLGGGGRAVHIAYISMAAVTLLRASSLDVPWLAVGANALGAVAGFLELPAIMTAVYNLAKASPCALRFHIAADGGWDVGCAAGCLIAAAMLAQHMPMGWAILLAVPGLACTAMLLRRHYRRAAQPTISTESRPLRTE